MKTLRKLWMPWTAADLCANEGAFQTLLNKRLKLYGNLRALALIPTAILLVGGYLLDRRPMMVASVGPLAIILLLSVLMDKTEAAMTTSCE